MGYSDKGITEMHKLGNVTTGLVCAAAVCVAAQAEQPKFAVPGSGSGCFDFADLTVGERYVVGQVVETRYGPVELVDYTLNRTTPNPDEPAAIRAEVDSSSIAGTGPELRLYLINAAFVPDKPLKKVTFDVAESWAGGVPTGAHSNLSVNGARVEVPNSLRAIDGKKIGRKNRGKAKVTVDITQPAPDSNWATGSVQLEAVGNGKIHRVAWGGRQVKIDNVCFEEA